MIAIVEHVLPERAVRVGDVEVAEEAAAVEVEADVEAVLRRQVQLGQREVRRRLGLVRVVHEHADVAG